MPFFCSICEQESTRICVACTKDTCDNHLCEKCSRCSDCCTCELALDEEPPHPHPPPPEPEPPIDVPPEPMDPPIEDPPIEQTENTDAPVPLTTTADA